jgi:hypothetical protein
MSNKLIKVALILVGLGFTTLNLHCQENTSGNKHLNFKYIPKDYGMNRIDTLLNDSIRLVVNHYTLMDSFATAYGVVADSVACRYRDYALEIVLRIHGKEIIRKKLQKSDFITDEKYLPNLSLFKVWLKPDDIENNQITLRIGIGIPDFNTPVIARLILGYNGNSSIKLK